MSHPRYVQDTVSKWGKEDCDAITDHVLAGVTTDGYLAYPYSYIIRSIGGVYDAINSVGTRVYGGAADVGGVDGGDASAVIQAVVDAAASGDTIIFKKGSYVLTSKITITDKALHLVGEAGAKSYRTETVGFTSTTISSDYFFEVIAATVDIFGGSIRNIAITNANFGDRDQYGILVQSILATKRISNFTLANITVSYLTRVITLDGYVWCSTLNDITSFSYNGTFAGEYVLCLEKSTDTLGIFYAPKWTMVTNLVAEAVTGDELDYVVLVNHPRSNYNVFNKITTWGYTYQIALFYDCGQSNTWENLHTQDVNLSGDPVTFEALFIIEKKDAPEAGEGTEASYGGFGITVRGFLAGHDHVVKFVGSPFYNYIEVKEFTHDVEILGTAGAGNHLHVSNASHCGVDSGQQDWDVINTAGIIVTGAMGGSVSFTAPFVTVDGGSAGIGYRGWDIDATNEGAHTFLTVPQEATSVVAIRMYAMSNVTETHAMNANLQLYGGASNEAYTAWGSGDTDAASATTNFAQNDIIYWDVSSAVVATLAAGDCIDIHFYGRPADGDNCATDCAARCVELVYRVN